MQKLIVIGAGPKAMAIAAKNAVLAELGFRVPEIHVIERKEIGANWTGNSGFTNGRLTLGTSPEKDVGFPYQSDTWGSDTDARVNRRMKDFSWASFLVDRGEYSDWVDRNRPAPEHRHWAEYLQWVYARVGERVFCHGGEVSRLSLVDDRWHVEFRTRSGEVKSLEGDGLVVTGPGKVKLGDSLPVHDRLLTVESFWRRYESFRDASSKRVAVIGSGENAAAIALALTQTGHETLSIDIVSPSGMAFSRGESFRENRVYSNAEVGHWKDLSVADRKQFIYRTDRGVFSQHAQRVLDHAHNVDIVPGRMAGVTAKSGGRLGLVREYDGNRSESEYDFVVVATGADQLAFLRGLLDPKSEREVCARAAIEGFEEPRIEEKIDESLALAALTPRLHLPMLSGVSQGPGFANLSCLGRLSDRILRPYVM